MCFIVDNSEFTSVFATRSGLSFIDLKHLVEVSPLFPEKCISQQLFAHLRFQYFYEQFLRHLFSNALAHGFIVVVSCYVRGNKSCRSFVSSV